MIWIPFYNNPVPQFVHMKICENIIKIAVFLMRITMVTSIRGKYSAKIFVAKNKRDYYSE